MNTKSLNKSKSNKTYIFNVHGMHCKSCVFLIESEIGALPNITYVKSSLNNHSLTVTGDFGDNTVEQIVEELTVPLKSRGYTLSLEKGKSIQNWSDFKIAIPIAVMFAVLFVILQKIGLVNIVNTNSLSYGTIFAIGAVASLSTCMAVVGGIVLSMSATFAKEGDKTKPQVLFHLGRLISFFVLGGVIGVLGSAFTLNTFTTFILSLIIGIVMLILGINLLDIFHFTKKFQPSMPKFLSRHALNITKINHTFTPFLVGLATFFLPCGFTQSMQIYTLTAGGFFQGGMIMFMFALGTFPILALLSFSSFSINKSSKSGIFFKTVGLIVIMFAIFNLINSMVVIGLMPSLFNF